MAGYDARTQAPARNGLATAALVSGLASFVCAPLVGGVVAVVFGFLARAELRKGNGQSGKGFALAGLLLGAANLALVATGLTLAFAQHRSAAPDPPLASGNAPSAPNLPPPGARPPARPGPGHFSEDGSVRSVRVGSLELIDIGNRVDSLSAELERQAALAERADKVLVVWVSATNCAPCNGVAAALDDPRMQRALAPARMVRVDRDDFALELDALGIPVDRIPGFALLDAGKQPVDYVDGGEWDEDIAVNVAPVLARFIRGNYKARRRPWRGGKRRDVTAL